MSRFLMFAAFSLFFVIGITMSDMGLSKPTRSTSLNSIRPSSALFNTTDPLTSTLVRRNDAWDDHWNKWAQFCDDDTCSKNCGKSVLMSNQGCLEQPLGRRSIKVHGMRRGLESVKLVVSPRKGCHCQAACTPLEWQGPHVNPQQYPLRYGQWPIGFPSEYCWNISDLEWTNKATEWSFHFEQGEDEEAQCWPDQCGWNNERFDNKPQPPHRTPTRPALSRPIWRTR